MASYELQFKKSVVKDLRKIPNSDVKKILQRVQSLVLNPRGSGCVKLSGQERYRIVYEIKDDEIIVVVVKVAHRYRVYSSD